MFKRRRKQGAEPSIEIGEDRVRRQLEDGGVEEVAWDELEEVVILTTSDGPFADDVFFALGAGDHGVVVPQSHADEAFVRRLQALPGFDNDAFIEAMSSTDEARFVCWRRGA